MSSKDILKNLQDAVDFMDRHPVAIAIALTPSFKTQLTTGNHLNSIQIGTGIMSYSSLRTYIWKDLPEPYRIYYNQTILARDIALYNS